MGKLNFAKNIMLVEKTLPENLKKKQERDARLAEALTKARETRKAAVKGKKKEWENRGKAHHENHQAEQRRIIDATRAAAANGEIFVPAEHNVFLVVRIKGTMKAGPKERLILRLLRLRQINNAVFLKVNKATKNMLQRVNQYVTYGFPNRKTVQDLLYKRGYGKVNGQRVRLSNNFIVEDNLKKYDCICMEDVATRIVSCGKNFKEVNNFIWPFKLKTPKGGYERKTKSYLNRGTFGDREARINN